MNKFVLLLLVFICQSLNAQQGRMCRLNVERITTLDQQTKSYALGKKTKLQHKNQVTEEREVQQLLMTPGYPSKISVDDSTLVLKCTLTSSNMMNVEIGLDSANSSLSTSLSIGPGSRIELGSIIKDLKGSDQNIDSSTGIEISNSRGKRRIQTFLSN